MMPLILPATESYPSSYSPSQICCTLLKLREHTGIIIMMQSMGINFLFVQPEPWPPNFFMEISQGPLDISQNTF